MPDYSFEHLLKMAVAQIADCATAIKDLADEADRMAELDCERDAAEALREAACLLDSLPTEAGIPYALECLRDGAAAMEREARAYSAKVDRQIAEIREAAE